MRVTASLRSPHTRGMRRAMPRIVQASALAAFLVILSACAPQTGPLPTIIALGGTPTPASNAESAAPSSPTPEPTTPLIPTPEPFLGRFANDPARRAELIVVHAAPGTDPVDVDIRRADESDDAAGVAFTTGLAFRNAVGRTPILAGDYSLRFRPTNAEANDAPLTTATASLRPGETVFAILTGTPDAVGVQFYSENGAPLEAGQSRLTFIHAVPRFPDAAPADGEDTIAEKVAFGGITGGLVVPSRNTSVAMRDEQTVFASRDLELRSRVSYTFVLAGDPADPESLALLSFDRLVAQRLRLRVVHAAEPALGPVDVYLDAILLAAGVAPGTATERINAGADVGNLFIYPAGADRANATPLIPGLRFSFDASTSLHTLAVLGTSGDLRALVIPETLDPIGPDLARFVFVNALPTARGARVGGQSTLFAELPELAFARYSPPAELTAGTQRLFWEDVVGGAGAILERVDAFNIEAGRYYLYLLTGREDGVGLAFSEPLPVDANLPLANATPGAQETAAASAPAVRLVNMLDGGPSVNATVNADAPIPLAYAQSSGITALPESVFSLSVLASDTGLPLRVDTVSLPEPGPYTVVIYGDLLDVRFGIFSDRLAQAVESSAHVRFINLTRDQRLFMGFRLGEPNPPDFGIVSGSPDGWPTLPQGSLLTVGQVPGGRASAFIPVIPNTFDLQVVDQQRNRIGQVVRSYTIQPGERFDVIAFEVLGVPIPEIRAFVVPYPQP